MKIGTMIEMETIGMQIATPIGTGIGIGTALRINAGTPPIAPDRPVEG